MVVLAALPLTANGKIDKKALPAPDAGLLRIPYVAPETETERRLAGIWAELLQLKAEEISSTAHFFQVGGHSLLAVRLVSGIRDAFGVELNMKDVFVDASVRALAESIDTALRRKELARDLAAASDDQLEKMEF